MARVGLAGLAVALAVAVALIARSGGSDTPPAVDPYVDHYELSQDVQRFLWEIEKRAFILANEVCPRLGRALVARDAEEWETAFADGFVGTVPTGPGQSTRRGAVERTHWGQDAPSRTVDPKALFAWLASVVDRFDNPEKVQVHFEDLVPERREDLDGAYLATWTIRLRGALREGGVRETDILCELRLVRAPAGVDTEWIGALNVVDRTDRTAPRRLMEDITARTGIATLDLLDRWAATETEEELATRSYSSYLLDYDRDGRLDLLFTDRRLWLYRGKGDGSFEDKTEAAGLADLGPWNLNGGTVGDFDNDGDEDLLLLATQPQQAFVLALENRDGFFVRVPDSTLAIPGVDVTDGSVADYDNDGLVDLYLPVSGEPLPSDQVRMRWIGNRHEAEGVLLRNLGGWRFEDVTKKAGALSGHRDIFAAAWTDFDLDGYPDLILAHHLGDNVVLHNRRDGTFRSEIVSEGFGGFAMGVDVGDLDNDGDPDAYFANMGSFAGTRIIRNLRPQDYPPGVLALVQGWVLGNIVLENGGGDGFREAYEHYAGWAYGPALTDLDGDGLLDLYSPAGFQTISRERPDG